MSKNDVNKQIWFRRLISVVALTALLTSSVPFGRAQGVPLPAPGTMVTLSPSFSPPVLKGIKVYRNDPFHLDFILDKGDALQTDELCPCNWQKGEEGLKVSI